MKLVIKTILMVLFFSLILQNCAVLKAPFRKTIVRRSVPYGIDPAVHRWAKVKADSLIPSKESKSVADKLVTEGQKDLEVNESLWSAIERFRERALKDTLEPPPPPEKQEVEINDDEIMVVYLKKDTLKTKTKTAPKDTITEPLLKYMAKLYLDNAMAKFLEAREINRFDLETITKIAESYSKNAERFQDTTSSLKSIEQYEYIARYQKGFHQLFVRLGDNYRAINDWPNAYTNYKEALRVFLATSSLKFVSDSATASIDSVESQKILTDYWINKAEAETQLNLPDSAIVSYLHALQSAIEQNNIAYIEHQINRIMWDSLNIRAVVIRDSVNKLYAAEKYVEARLGYQNLLKSIKTQKARDEIEFALAEMNYVLAEKLKEKLNLPEEKDLQKEAVQNVVKIVTRADANKNTPETYEAPVDYNVLYYLALDSTGTRFIRHKSLTYNQELIKLEKEGKLKVDSTYKIIFNRAGNLCFDYGQTMMNKGEYLEAKFYLNHASEIDWGGSYKSLFILARFHSIRANPRLALKNCYNIAKLHHKMTPEETKQYLYFLVNLFRKRGVDRSDISRQFYSIYNNYINGGPVPWDIVFHFLEPYKV